VKLYDESEQSGKPHGPEEREGTTREVGQEGIRPPDAGVGQTRRQAEGKRQERKKTMIETETNLKQAKRKDNDGLHKRRGIWHYKMKVAGRRKEISTRTTSYQEARKVRDAALQAQREGRLPTDMGSWPLDKAAKEWLVSRTRLVAPQTARIDRERLVPLLQSLGGHRLSQITAGDISGYQLQRMAKVSPRTVNLETKVLRMILRSAKSWSHLADDYKALREDKRGPGRALATEEERHLFDVASSNPNWSVAYYAALIAANTTARGCEIKGLRLCDIDLEARTMTIRRASTKTDAGCRIVPLNTEAAWALARLLERASFLGAVDPHHYVFPAFTFRHTKEGQNSGAGYDPAKPMKSWRSAWRKLTRRAGLGGLRFHDLRHHCITRLAEAGVAEQTLMAIAGHVSREMLEHYSHIRMQAKRDAVSMLEMPAVSAEANGVSAVN
jgi:integrase